MGPKEAENPAIPRVMDSKYHLYGSASSETVKRPQKMSIKKIYHLEAMSVYLTALTFLNSESVAAHE